MEKQRESGHLKAQFEERLKAAEERNAAFEQQLQAEIEKMKTDLDEAHGLLTASQEELQRLRSENRQWSQLRSHWEEEKELDILTLKKELLTQKEMQLTEMQTDMAKRIQAVAQQAERERQSLQQALSSEILRREAAVAALEAYTIERKDREVQTDRVIDQPLVSDLKRQHFGEMERLMEEGTIERETMAKKHVIEVEQLRGLIAEKERLLAGETLVASPSVTAEALRRIYPAQIAEIEAATEYKAKEIQSGLQQKYASDLEMVSTRLKEQCARAYDSAVSKLKTEFRRAEEAVNERHASEMKRRVTENDALQDTLSRTRIAHQQEKAQLTETHASTLAAMKKKYILTLQAMRDEVVRGKQKSLERVESEWRRRKQRLDSEWAAR